jgi:hypothetical protein
LLGATDEEMAAFFSVATSTFYLWQRKHPEFRQALKEGKLVADATVAESLYKRALGYSHKAVKIVADAKTGTEHIVPYTEHYPPDTTAAIFWLKNRRRADWRDARTVGGDDKTPFQIEVNGAADRLRERIEAIAARLNADAKETDQ